MLTYRCICGNWDPSPGKKVAVLGCPTLIPSLSAFNLATQLNHLLFVMQITLDSSLRQALRTYIGLLSL